MDTDARPRYAWTTAFSLHGVGGGGGDPIGPPIARERAMGSAAGRNRRFSIYGYVHRTIQSEGPFFLVDSLNHRETATQ